MSSIKEATKRTVFKPLLDNPYTDSKFPEIDQQNQQQIVDFLLHILNPLAIYSELVKESKLRKSHTSPTPPEIASDVVFGYNNVVNSLERQVKQQPSTRLITYVFVCRNDIKPVLLTSHFPSLCYLVKNSKAPENIKLIQLPRGAMERIDTILAGAGIRFGGILGLVKSELIPTEFTKLLDEAVPDVQVDWLAKTIGSRKSANYKPVKVKFLKTTAIIKPRQNQKEKKKVQKPSNK